MNVVDSSAWLTFFANDVHADYFAEPIERGEALIVPSLSLYEMFKNVLQQRGERGALQAVALMRQGEIIDLDASMALIAARVKTELKLTMAGSVMAGDWAQMQRNFVDAGRRFRGNEQRSIQA